MKKRMYYLCMAMWVFSVLMSCNDDDAQSPSLRLLAKIERDGINTLELKYDAEKKLVRMNTFTFSNGVMNQYTIYEYNNQGIQESRQYNAVNDDLTRRVVYTLNNVGLIVKAEEYTAVSDFKDVEGTYVFIYDAAGHLTNKTFNLPGEPTATLTEITYDAAGNRIKFVRTNDPYKPDYEVNYTPGQKPLPDHWHEYLHILSVSEADKYLWDMFCVSKRETTFNDEGVVTSDYLTEESKQQFDANGYLTQQKVTRTSLSNLSPEVVTVMMYEYTE